MSQNGRNQKACRIINENQIKNGDDVNHDGDDMTSSFHSALEHFLHLSSPSPSALSETFAVIYDDTHEYFQSNPEYESENPCMGSQQLLATDVEDGEEHNGNPGNREEREEDEERRENETWQVIHTSEPTDDTVASNSSSSILLTQIQQQQKKPIIYSITINQDRTCIAIGTDFGC